MTETGELAPTCYRHPDRETYVSCTRCERPICPDCMNDAAVGFQCPDCVREGSKSVREARTVFGGRVQTSGVLIRGIIVINVIAFVATISSDARMLRFGDIGILVASGEYYRLLTSAFLHANLLHIGFNMFALYAFGGLVEAALGRWRFIALYLVSALGGSALSYTLGRPDALSLGASGAVFGVAGALFVIGQRLRADTSQIGFFIVMNLVLGQVIPNIDNWAHIGGLVSGGLVALAFARIRGPQRDIAHALAVVAVLGLLAAVVVVRTEQLRDEFPVLREAAPSPPTASQIQEVGAVSVETTPTSWMRQR